MQRIEQIYEWVDAHREEMVQFLCEGIQLPSTTGNEACFQEWLHDRFRQLAFDTVDKFAVDEQKKRPNVVGVYKGVGGGRSLMLNGHSDVVPAAEAGGWKTNPWQGCVSQDQVFGRGAVDMKGGLTAMTFAARAIMEAGIRLKGDLLLASVVGEELCEHDIGTSAVIEHGYRASFAIVLEPTGCELHVKSPSAATWELSVQGKEVHNAQANKVNYPQPYGTACGAAVGVDAFKKSIKIMEAFENLEQQWNMRWRDRILGGGGYPHKDHNGVGVYAIVPAIIRSGDYLVSVPGYAKIQGGVNYAPWISFDEMGKEMRKTVDAVVACDDWMQENPPEFHFLYNWPGYMIEPEHPGCQALKKAVEDVTDEPAMFTGFPAVDDASFLCQAGIPAVTFGPGSIENHAHGDNEFIEISQIVTAVKTLIHMIIDWCGVA